MKRALISILAVIITIGVATGIYFYTNYDIRFCVILIPIGTLLLGIVLGYVYFKCLMKARIKIKIKDYIILIILAIIVFVGISFVKFGFEVHNNNEELVKCQELGYINYIKNRFDNAEFVMYEKDFFTRKAFANHINKTSHKIIYLLYTFIGLIIPGLITASTDRKAIKYCEKCTSYMEPIYLAFIPLIQSDEFSRKLSEILSAKRLTIGLEIQDLFDEFDNEEKKILLMPRLEVRITYCSNCNRYELDMKRYRYIKNFLIRKIDSFCGNSTLVIDKSFKYDKVVSYDAIKEILRENAKEQLKKTS